LLKFVTFLTGAKNEIDCISREKKNLFNFFFTSISSTLKVFF